MEFTTQLQEEGEAAGKQSEFSASGLQLETVFSTDWFMLDMGSADASAIVPEAVIRDCEFVIEIVRKYPEKLDQMIQAFQPDAPLSDIENAIAEAKRIGFTEQGSIKSGGGLLGLLIVAGAALLLGGCAHCNSHAKGKKTTPSK
jgi:hypothetical protein